VTLVDGRPRTDRSDGRKSGGDRRVNRDEIRQEALRWLREVNVAPSDQPEGLSWYSAWSRDLAWPDH
jgi:hypothetical protein